MNNYTFQATTESNIPAILRIITEAQCQLKGLNINQWQNGYPNKDTILKDIKEGYSFVYISKNRVIATLAFRTDKDPTYEIIKGKWLSSTAKYGTIHRMSVANQYKGKHLASQLFNLIEKKCKNQKIEWLRVDTHQNNMPMLKVIERQEFTYCGIIRVTDGSERLAFEKKII